MDDIERAIDDGVNTYKGIYIQFFDRELPFARGLRCSFFFRELFPKILKFQQNVRLVQGISSGQWSIQGF